MSNPPETRDDVISNDNNTNADINQDNEELIKNEYAERSILDTADEINNLDIPVSDKLGSGKQINDKRKFDELTPSQVNNAPDNEGEKQLKIDISKNIKEDLTVSTKRKAEECTVNDNIKIF